MKTNTEKVRTDMKRLQDWTKALVAESLTNRICFRACISILVRFSCSVIVLVCFLLLQLLSPGSQLGVEHRS